MKINPLYILLLLVAIFGVVIYKSQQSQTRYLASQEYLDPVRAQGQNHLPNPAKELAINRESSQKLNAILRHPLSENRKSTVRHAGTKSSSPSKKSNKQAMDMLTNKLLNETLQIDRLAITRDDANHGHRRAGDRAVTFLLKSLLI